MSSGALAGIRVVELGQMVSAPYCAKLFSDYGADVIKLELPAGDAARNWGPFPADEPHPEKSGLFAFLNTNKRSVKLDPADAAGREVLLDLLAEADILVENFLPKQWRAWGLDYNELSARNPNLVMVSITPFGQTGPYADWNGYDLNAYHLTGASSRYCGRPDEQPLEEALDRFDDRADHERHDRNGSLLRNGRNSSLLFGFTLRLEDLLRTRSKLLEELVRHALDHAAADLHHTTREIDVRIDHQRDHAFGTRLEPQIDGSLCGSAPRFTPFRGHPNRTRRFVDITEQDLALVLGRDGTELHLHRAEEGLLVDDFLESCAGQASHDALRIVHEGPHTLDRCLDFEHFLDFDGHEFLVRWVHRRGLIARDR
jgi:hypothetical protein